MTREPRDPMERAVALAHAAFWMMSFTLLFAFAAILVISLSRPKCPKCECPVATPVERAP